MAQRSDDLIRLLPVAATRALLAIDGPASATWNTVVQATKAYEGPAGSGITLAAVADGSWVACVGTLTLAANPGDTETATIGTKVYTFQTALTNVDGNVLIGASASATLDNLIAAINAAAGAGTTYAAATVEHTQVRAYAGAGDTMVVHSRPEITAAVGTLIATTDGMANAGNVWGAATLADGTDGTNVTFVTTGDDVVCHYASGYSTVEDFEAALAADASAGAVMEVKTAGTTPLYLLVVTDDDFTATAFTGSGATSSAAPSLTDPSVYKKRPFYSNEALVMVRSTAGSGTMTATVTLWGWNEALSRGVLIGLLNEGTAIPEAAADVVSFSQLAVGNGKFSAFYAQLAVAGTGTEAAVYMDFVRPGAHD